MMVKEKNNIASIFHNKCEMILLTKVLILKHQIKCFKYHVLPLANMIIKFFF